MQFTIKKERFLKGLLVASKAVASKTVIPLLVNIKLELDDKGLSIIASNNDLAIKTIIPYMEGEVEIIRSARHGSALVNAKLITEIVRKSEKEDISFDVVDDTIARISDGKSNFKLNSIKADEYPDIDLEPSGIEVYLSAEEFIAMVDQVAFAASTKEQRPILTAINFEALNGVLTATTTDSARLARKEIKIATTDSFVANVPAKTASDIARLLEGEENVSIAISDKKALFTFGLTVVSSRLINGEYPSTRSIVPKTFNYQLEVNAQELLSAMDRVSLLSIERENVVKLSMSETGVEVSSKDSQAGSATESVSIFQYTSSNLDVSFNSAFVASAIRAVKSEDVILAFLGEMKPFVVKSTKDDSIIQLVTPVRTY